MVRHGSYVSRMRSRMPRGRLHDLGLKQREVADSISTGFWGHLFDNDPRINLHSNVLKIIGPGRYTQASRILNENDPHGNKDLKVAFDDRELEPVTVPGKKKWEPLRVLAISGAELMCEAGDDGIIYVPSRAAVDGYCAQGNYRGR